MEKGWKLTFRSTFIDVVQDLKEDASKRARSEPPTSKAFEEASEAHFVASTLKSSTERLFSEVDKLWQSPVQGGADPELGAQVEELPRLPSIGSLGHPETCKRPCVHFVARGCPAGESCEYCHGPHPKRPPSLDKCQRGLLKKMEESAVLALVLPLLKLRVETRGLTFHATRLFQLLEQRQHEVPDKEVNMKVSNGEQQALRRVMNKMSIAGLMGLVTSRAELDVNYVESLKIAVEEMRKAQPYEEG
mmetsp:Transcript_41861/g.97475  ORF Transcript_41861/g.97475 Transcript_41861/m.97475 type:complete len:247 (+) Transcript_41861:76-816(+)